MRAKCAVVVAFLSLLWGCQTPYQDMGYTGGVSAVPISTDTYRISARGNGYTAQTVVQDYVLLKAAETTLQAGHTHFIILGSQDATRQEFGQTPGTVQTNIIGRTAYSTYTPGISYSIVKPGQDVFVQIGSPSPGATLGGAFNAAEVFAAINPRVQRPK